MTAEEQLAYEARVRPRQAIVAGAAALALVAAAAVQVVGPTSKVSELTVQLLLINKRFPLDLIGAVFQGIGVLALVWTLAFLFDLSRARRPQTNSATRTVVLIAGVVSALGATVYAAILAVKAHQFATQGAQTYPQANHLTHGAALPVLQTLDIAAQFGLDICLILIALNGMRVGLLTRFMGYTGIIVGIAGMLLIGSAPSAALQVFWMGALAILFLGRWPGGEPPAWRTGEAEPWPSSQQLREQRMASRGATPRAKPLPEPAAEPVGAGSPARTRAATPKRKRKRRR